MSDFLYILEHVIKKRRTIPTDIAIVTEWDNEKGGRIVECRLESTTILSSGFTLYASKTVACQVKITKRMVLTALAAILIVIAAVVIARLAI